MEYISSRYFNGTTYEVVLQENEPRLMIISMSFKEDLTHLSDDELISKIWDKLYRERLEGKFNREAYDLVETKTEEMDNAIVGLNETVDKVKESVNIIDSLEKRVNVIVKAVELSEEQMNDIANSYPAVVLGDTVVAGGIYQINGVLYSAIKDATITDPSWIGDPSLFTAVKAIDVVIDEEPVTVIPEFKKPTGAHDAYDIGDQVTFEGEVYESTIDTNTYSPIEHPDGWKLV